METDDRRVFASVRSRWSLVSAAVFAYAVVFTLVILFERPGLGIAHGFYVAIVLLALAGGPGIGAVGGTLAAGLYVAGVIVNPLIPPSALSTTGAGIRLVMFVGVGLVCGWFARRNRAILAQLKALAERDHLTGLMNSRAFERAFADRIATGRPFGLLFGDIDSLKQINDTHGHAEGDNAIRRLADALLEWTRDGDLVARVGGDEFAILVSTGTEAEASELVERLELELSERGSELTLGWAVCPAEAQDSFKLMHLADARLYERKAGKPNRRSLRLVSG